MLKALAIAAMLATAATAARAEPSFDLFKQFCVDTRASHTAALAAAEGAGWTPVPKGMLSSIKLGDEVSDLDGRMTSAADGLRVLVVAHASGFGDAKGLQADACVVATTAPDAAETLKSAASAFAGVEAGPGPGGGSPIFIWRDGAKGHERVSLDELRAHPDPAMSAMTVQVNGPATLLILAVPTK